MVVLGSNCAGKYLTRLAYAGVLQLQWCGVPTKFDLKLLARLHRLATYPDPSPGPITPCPYHKEIDGPGRPCLGCLIGTGPLITAPDCCMH